MALKAESTVRFTERPEPQRKPSFANTMAAAWIEAAVVCIEVTDRGNRWPLLASALARAMLYLRHAVRIAVMRMTRRAKLRLVLRRSYRMLSIPATGSGSQRQPRRDKSSSLHHIKSVVPAGGFHTSPRMQLLQRRNITSI